MSQDATASFLAIRAAFESCGIQPRVDGLKPPYSGSATRMRCCRCRTSSSNSKTVRFEKTARRRFDMIAGVYAWLQDFIQAQDEIDALPCYRIRIACSPKTPTSSHKVARWHL